MTDTPKRSTFRNLIPIVAAAIVGVTIGLFVGRIGVSDDAAPVPCQPSVHADPAAVAAFFKAWDDPAARGSIGPDTPKEVVLAEILRLVLHGDPSEAIGGFNAYMNKAALAFSEEEINEVGRLLTSKDPKERQQGFLRISASDLEAALLVSTVLMDPRTAVAPAPPPAPPEEPESEEASPAPPSP